MNTQLLLEPLKFFTYFPKLSCRNQDSMVAYITDRFKRRDPPLIYLNGRLVADWLGFDTERGYVDVVDNRVCHRLFGKVEVK